MGKKITETPELSKSQIKLISEAAALAAIEAYKKEIEKDRQECRDKRLYNTRILMERYRGMVKYCENAIYTNTQIDDDLKLEELLAMMGTGRNSYILSVDSIKERVAITRVILDHVKKMLDFYEFRCKSSGKDEIVRKWETVKYLYLDEEELTVKELAEKFYVDERTVYRYNTAAMKDISALLFGAID